jgi:hypothetical protein
VSISVPHSHACSQLIVQRLQLSIIVLRYGRYPSKKDQYDLRARRDRLHAKIAKFHVLAVAMLGEDICENFGDSNTAIVLHPEDNDDESDQVTAPVPDDSDTPAERILLMLPSALGDYIRTKPSMASICARELDLRRGHANDALQDIRTAISHKSFQYTQGYRIASAKSMKTRSRAAVDNLSKMVGHSRRVYSLCRERMLKLGLPAEEQISAYQIITDKDVHTSTAIRTPNERGQSRYQLSWIFTTELQRMENQNPNQYLSECKCPPEILCRTTFIFLIDYRIHWLRGRAQAMRWKEEETLVGYEMLWTTLSFRNRSRHWKDMELQGQMDGRLGVAAYAAKQRDMWRKLAGSAEHHFSHHNAEFKIRLTQI